LLSSVALSNVGLDTEASVNLHGSRRDAAKLVLDGGGGVSFNDHAFDAVIGEAESGCEAIQAATHDQDGDFGRHCFGLLEGIIVEVLQIYHYRTESAVFHELSSWRRVGK
jgi:hypothetical protein